MKRLFYLLIGLILAPALLYAQGTLSVKDLLDYVTANYYTKVASDARYATTTYGYSSAEVDILLAPKADKTYVNATDEAIISDNDSQDVQIEANRVGVASLEVGLQTHQNNPTGAHAATAISATWTNVQVSLDSIEAAIQGIVVGSGFALESWVNSTLETNFYNKTQTDDTIAAAIAAIPAADTNQEITVEAGEDLSAGEVVSLINSGGSVKAYNTTLTVSTSPNGAESVFNSAATTYCSAVALDSTRFLVAYRDSDTYPKAIIGTVSGSTISWGSESAAFESVAASYVSVCKIATDKVLASYSDGTNNYGQCVVLSISSSTITPGTPISFITVGGVAPTYISSTTLETDKALIAYYNAFQATGVAMVITVSGTTPSKGSAFGTEFNAISANSTAYISLATLSSTSAIVAYQDTANSSYGTAQVLSISGTTITPGTEYVFNSGTTDNISTIIYTSSKAIISYRNTTTAYIGKSIVATNTSGVIEYGTPYSFITGTGASISSLSSAYIENGYFILSYAEGSASDGYSQLGKINNDNSIIFETYKKVNTYTGTSTTICYLGSRKSIIAYQDAGNSSYGTAVVNTWATTSYASVAGISSGNYSSGSDAVVLISGVDSNQSGLITGSPYFLQSDFTIGTTPVSLAKYYNSSTATGEIKIGTAKSATELIVGIDYK